MNSSLEKTCRASSLCPGRNLASVFLQLFAVVIQPLRKPQKKKMRRLCRAEQAIFMTGNEPSAHVSSLEELPEMRENMNFRNNKNEPGKKRPLRVLTVTGVYPQANRPHNGTFIKSQVESLKAEGLEMIVIHPEPGPMPIRYLSAVWQVFSQTLSGQFDLVHGHFGLWALTARLQWRTPVVVSYLGDDLLGRPIPGGFTRKSLLVVRVSRWLARHVDGIIVKSLEMRNILAKDLEVAIIPNGVNFNLFRPLPRQEVRAELGWDRDRCFFLFGNDPAIYRKGFALAEAAVALLKQRGREAEIIIGNNLPQDILVKYMNACNALILSSLIEGSPNIVKEAMACNVPVVSSDVGDVAQIIGRTAGCAVCPRTPEAFADALELAYQHAEPTTGRRDIAHLENSLVAKQVLTVYQQAIERCRRKEGQA